MPPIHCFLFCEGNTGIVSSTPSSICHFVKDNVTGFSAKKQTHRDTARNHSSQGEKKRGSNRQTCHEKKDDRYYKMCHLSTQKYYKRLPHFISDSIVIICLHFPTVENRDSSPLSFGQKMDAQVRSERESERE